MAASLPLTLQALSSGCATSGSSSVPTRQAGRLSWLEGDEPAVNAGTTWGQPWAVGELSVNDALRLNTEDGRRVPLQSWPTAYWPDGSIKWTAHAVPAGVTLGKQFQVTKGRNAAPERPVRVTSGAGAIEVDTGRVKVSVPTSGDFLIGSMARGDALVARNARLVGLVQDQVDPSESVSRVEAFQSRTDRVTVEQEGPVRAVVKIEGKHKAESGKEWLPFTVRLYFYSDAESLRISHTFIYDLDDQKDFIRGLGLRFDVLQRDEVYDRHVRFVGENDGLWAESPKGITGLRQDPGKAVREAQLAGRKTPPLSEWNPRVSGLLHYVPVWNDFTLSQLNANGFTIKKRTQSGHAWINADQGRRASGVAYVGGASGGVLFGMRDFWQLHPVQVDIRNAGRDVAEATLWFWSPEAPPMDVRFYHDGMGQETYEQQLDALKITYEDYEPGFDTAYGVARTTDFVLCVLSSTPSRTETVNWAKEISKPAQVVAAPEDYLQSGVFGALWSLPDRSTTRKKQIEDRLAWQVEHYCRQVDQHHWYGFWDYGDVMHTYDVDRHVWRYDIGGYAWDNSELSPDLWLWYSFLRSGDPDTFRLAEAMTRHTRDVDIYHLGQYRGLGTRHNVQHWGCSAKQLRVSTAAYRRFHYFLTGDDRTADVLDEVIDAGEALRRVDPTRKLPNREPVPGPDRLQVGTDWGSVAANWLTAWERTGDDQYRDRLVSAMRTIGGHPDGFFAGTYGFDADTKELLAPPEGDIEGSHLSSVFGLVEINAELIQLLDVPEYKAAWLRYCRLYNASDEQKVAAVGRAFGTHLEAPHSRLTAYAAAQEGDARLAKRAWQEFQLPQEFARQWTGDFQAILEVKPPQVLNPVVEAPWLSTNDASQWGLAAIQNLALIADEL
ncbi:Tat pathway signal sequence domain protein [Marinimicrobium sp. C6131]|uniref:exo-rhamnogalacturonan lyase family protein n=1 Tax=Marinimicrobium sp. C6131 TaxID=3022676 RepID=UPI00223D126C|nr:Tat pathway signal sequence domain protein [Marinimicrobium sp. C6131]UZJ44960.1 Tat pathway signal sequence domain protein [Marinimicrobium sp. C6131]